VSPSVFLSEEELGQLERLAQGGAEIEARGVPNDKPIVLSEIQERFQKGSV
jgi:mannose/fructose/N-acetylgalactosamine-specific phosphotransferase system component IIB